MPQVRGSRDPSLRLKSGSARDDANRKTQARNFQTEPLPDFPVWSDAKRVEKLRYIHRNPVHRGLVDRPEDWAWSSYRHYQNGAVGIVEIESQWTARIRERAGIFPTVRVRAESGKTPPIA